MVLQGDPGDITFLSFLCVCMYENGRICVHVRALFGPE